MKTNNNGYADREKILGVFVIIAVVAIAVVAIAVLLVTRIATKNQSPQEVQIQEVQQTNGIVKLHLSESYNGVYFTVVLDKQSNRRIMIAESIRGLSAIVLPEKSVDTEAAGK